jgi:preprotein translocase subunit SecG
MIIVLSIIFWILFLVWLACCAVLVLVILNQEPKGGGVGAMFGQGSVMGEALGVSGIAGTLRRITTFSAVTFMVLSIILAVIAPVIYGNSYGLGDGAPAAGGSQALAVQPNDDGAPIEIDLAEADSAGEAATAAATDAAATDATNAPAVDATAEDAAAPGDAAPSEAPAADATAATDAGEGDAPAATNEGEAR